MCWIFPYLSVLKGNFEGGKTGLSPIVTAVRSHLGFYLLKEMGAIAHGECFANAFPYLFSREKLRAVKKAIARSEYFVNPLDIP
ncbi:hypothetical protein [Cylindrospermopsis raciborskii]|uniref:hypothetical protein n=1 Tax=Cylindrospermopsis raciborskii TaxID=77022 RepID=UPI000778AE66|nr:hypothetical protein [Cylindrospermopsis raciborskii]